MSESELYKDGGTITTMNINKQNSEKARMFDDMKTRESFNAAVRNNLDAAVASGIKEGFIAGTQDFARRFSENGIVEGSPEDIQIQEGVDRGINYQAPQEPGLLDAINGTLSRASNGFSDWLAGPVATEQNPYAEQAAQAENDLIEDAQVSAFMTA